MCKYVKKSLLAFMLACMAYLIVGNITIYAQTAEEEINWDQFYDHAYIESYDESGVLLRSVSIQTRNITTQNTDTIVKLLPSDSQNAQELIDMAIVAQRTRSNTNYREMAEKAGCGTMYNEVNYSLVDSGNYVKLDSVRCGFNGSLSSGIRLVSSSAYIAQNGFYSGGYTGSQTKTVSGWPSLTGYPNSSWKPVANNDKSNVGANYTLTLKRGTDTWSTELNNNIFR